ncbi:hypothetical protein [Dactylosporangium sp. CA-139066]|uniref:hypothetical protein n=1 Tax=Dactylosporangium sp. CA-139066 TaxID=3239930 RepID=UPI003D92BDE6
MTITERPHGYARYKLEGCRCYTCAFAVSEYRINRQKRITAGTWRHDAEPVRVHLRSLAAAGIGARRVAELSGVNRSVLRTLLRGRKERGTPPPKTTRYDIAERILAVGLDHAPSAHVEASGTVRRAQALCAIGWTVSAVGEAIGWTAQNFCNLVSRGSQPYAAMVLARTAAAVAALYERESMRPVAGPAGDAARARAKSRGWLPPLAWDDDTIDDPDALPCILPPVDDSDPAADNRLIQQFAAGADVKLPWREKLEVVRRMHDRPVEELAGLLGVGPRSVSTMRSMRLPQKQAA